MTTPAAPAQTTLGELRASGHQYKDVKQEIRDNLLERLASGGERFPGIVGFDETVLPEMERALLAGDGGRSRRPLLHDSSAYAVLATSLGLEADALEAELAVRSEYLGVLADRGICDPPSVAAALAHYPSLPEGAMA